MDGVVNNRDDIKVNVEQQASVNLDEISKPEVADDIRHGVNNNCEIKINATRNRTGFLVDGLVQCTPITWKCDTGARKTFITEEQFYKIPPENRPVLEPARIQFANASGQNMQILGKAYMTLNFKTLKQTLEFLWEE